MKTTSLPPNSLTTSLSFGISLRQGPQAMNHKLTTTILPCSDFESKVLPSSETPRNSGAGSLKDEPELFSPRPLPSRYSSYPCKLPRFSLPTAPLSPLGGLQTIFGPL